MSTDSTPDTKALAEVTAPVDTGSLLAFASVVGGSATPFFTSIKTDTDAGKLLLFKVSEDTDHKVDDCLGQVIELEHVYIATAEKNDSNTGEVTSLKRCVLIDKQGTSYSTFSDGIAESIRKLIGIYGMPPWKAGLKVRLDKRKTSSGFRMFYLAPVLNSTPKDVKK